MSLDRFMALPRRSRSVLNSLVAQRVAQADGLRLMAWPHALGCVWKERLDIVSFLRTGDEALAYDLRRRFGLGAPLGEAHPVPATLFAKSPAIPQPQPATIIIPIHDAADMVERLLTHLPSTLPENQAVLLIDDGSKDPRISNIFNDFTDIWKQAEYVRLPRNLGFVGAVNTALEQLQTGNHAILLNSDTLPPRGWVARLLAPFAESDEIASVTPLSNNAEILSIPSPGIEGSPDGEMVERLDAVAQSLHPRRVELPTGIGFCMALNRRFIARIGGFDPAFGRGYGEEVDWCRRAMKLGGRHVVATNLIVGHSGGGSFAASERRARIAKASRTIAVRYPDYPAAALEWERRDPIAPERLAVGLAWAAHVAKDEIPVFIAHSLGGGAEHALQGEVGTALSNGMPAVVILRVGGPATWRLELRGQRFARAGDVDSTELVFDLLSPLTRRHVIYSCGVFAADPVALPETLERLAVGHRLSLRIHDFFPISPSWNLIGSDGRYAGVPPLDTTDPAHCVPGMRGQAGLPYRDWRARWGRVMDAARDITVFAASSRDLIEKAYPQAHGKTLLRPHIVGDLPARVAPGGQTIGVLGGINRAKGGAVLERLARATRRRIAIIGELDGQFHLPPPHIVHGRYDRNQISDLARRYDVGIWFLPSICPETFSFATHEALATGLPVASFDLGAQAETLKLSDYGHVLDADPDETDAIAARLEALFGR